MTQRGNGKLSGIARGYCTDKGQVRRHEVRFMLFTDGVMMLRSITAQHYLSPLRRHEHEEVW